MLNKLCNRYLLIFLGVAVSFSFGVAAQAADPTIHAVAGGGNWNNTSTWVEGRTPNSSDIVEVNGNVHVTENYTITGLSVSNGAILQNEDWTTVRLIVNGDAVNNGTIQRNTAPYNFYITVSGNITNNGIWNNSWTNLTTTQSRTIGGSNSLATSVTFEDNFAILNSPVFSGQVNFYNKTITLSSSTQSMTLRANSTLSGAISGQGSLIITNNSSISGTITAENIIFESGSVLGVFNVGQFIVRGVGNKEILMNYDAGWNAIPTVINGNLLIESGATIWNRDGNNSRLIVNGDIENNGLIRKNTNANFYLTVSGDIENNGTWNNSWTDFSSTQARIIGGSNSISAPVTFLESFSILNSPIFNSQVNFNNKTLTLGSSTQSITIRGNASLSGTIDGLGSLIFTNNTGINGNATATKIIFESGSIKGNFTAEQFIVSGAGNKEIAGNYDNNYNMIPTVFNGSVLIEEGATIHNKDYETSRLIINGDVVNNGTIQRNTAPYNFYLTVSENIINNGTWNNSWTDLSSTQDRNIGGANPMSSSVTFLDNIEILNSPIFGGQVNFNNKTITLSSSTQSITIRGNSTLSGTISGSGDLILTNGITVNGTITAGKVILESGSIKGTFNVDQFIVRGAGSKNILADYDNYWNVIPVVINGKLLVESGATIWNNSGTNPWLIINGDVENNGSISNNYSSGLYLKVSGNINNNGAWNNSSTDISWPPVFGATEYEVNISENEDNWPAVATTTNTSYNISSLISSSRYWRVRPSGGYWSSIKRINTGLFGGFAFDTISNSQMATRPISMTISAVDINGNPYSYSGSVGLSASNNGTTTPSTITMSEGSWTGTTSISMFGDNVTLTATGGGESGTSNTFNIKKKPVIIVPGVAGSYLAEFSSNTEVWPNVLTMLSSSTDDYLDELKLGDDGWPIQGSTAIVPIGIIRSIGTHNYFNGLIGLLESNGYSEGDNLFVFPYDWRLNIAHTANHEFKDKIGEIKTQTGSQEIDVVAHSMGGLVVEKYIQDNGQRFIDKFIDIATPHLGSPSAAKILLYGDDFSIHYFNLIGLNELKMKDIAKNFSSVYQLFPSRNYNYAGSNIFNSYIIDSYDADNNNATGTLDYDESIDYLTNMGANSTLVALNDDLHDDLDSFNPNDYGIKAYNIIGCNNATVGWMEIINQHGTSTYEYGLHYTNGDGTVPLESARSLNNTIGTYYNITNDESATHALMPSFEDNKQLINAILNSTSSAVLFNFSSYPNLQQDSSECTLNGWEISYHSPIALHIYDEQGRHIGPDEKGNIEINIPGAAYDVIGDNKFAFVPKGHNYKVIGRATGLGHFNARIQDIQDGKTISAAYYNEVPIKSLDTNIEINFANNKPNYEMKIDQKGDKVFREKIKPNSILNAKEAEDRTKPETRAEIIGQAIKLASNDSNSKILKTEYSLDGGKSWIVYTKTIDASRFNGTTIQYKSTDRAGNVEIIQEQVISVDKNTLKPNLSNPKKVRF